MGMTKLITPLSTGEKPAELIKVSNQGLRGNDLRSFIKRASVDMVGAMEKISLHKGEIPIHLIAIGATEFYGPNRNGDGFDDDVCRDYHHTFVKYARWFRNHKNKDTSQSYGTIKYSCYNEQMKRIELIVALNGTKEAAERNHGLVADRELEKLASGKEDWGVSMACKVAHDVCSWCGNKATTRDDYCTEDTCAGGGLKNNITKVASNGHILHAKNPKPKFFDISDVFRPADRIAFVLGEMDKAAAAGGVSLDTTEDDSDLTEDMRLAKAACLSLNPHTGNNFLLTAELVIRNNYIT